MIHRLKNWAVQNPFIILFIFSLCTRLLGLFFGMPSVTNDEADIYTSSYIFGQTLRDFHGNWWFLTTGILTAKPSVPVFIGAIPWLFTSGKSVILARLPFVILNSLSPVIFYYLIRSLTKKTALPFLSFLVMNFAPWYSYASSTGYEAMVALFFILSFFLVTVSRLHTYKKMAFALFTSLCAFNSYMGMKPVFPFVLFVGVFFFLNGHKSKLSRKLIFYATVLTFVIFAIFIAMNYFAPNSSLVKREYSLMLAYYEKPKIEGMVWFERWTSSGPDKLITLLSNKYTIRLRDHVSKYFLSFNPELFFRKGDPSSLYGTADLSGLFFVTDFIFFILGLYYIASIKERGLKMLLLLFFFGGLPVALSNTAPTFILRGIILLIPYSVVIAYGMYQIIQKRKKFVLLIGLLVLLNYSLYFTVYKVRIFNLNGEQWKYTIKIISEVVADRLEKYSSLTIYNPEAQETFLQYAFYEINDPYIIIDRMKNKNFTYRNLVITDGCPKHAPKYSELIVFNKENCGIPSKDTELLRSIEPLDRSGKDYYIVTGRQKD